VDEEQKQLFLMFSLDEFTERTMKFPLGYLQTRDSEDEDALRVAALAALFEGVTAVMTKHGPLVRDPDSPFPGPNGPTFIYRANERSHVEMAVSPRGISPTLVVDGERLDTPEAALPQIYWNCGHKEVVGQRTRTVTTKPYPIWDREDPKIELITSLQIMRYGIKKAEDGNPWRRPKPHWAR
jgi:hypothetical protein